MKLTADSIESGPDKELEEILRIVNFHERFSALKDYFDKLDVKDVPEKARFTAEKLKESDLQTQEQFLDYLLGKKLITGDLWKELSHGGPAAGMQGHHTETHLEDISKTGI